MYDKTVRRRRVVLGLLVASSLILLTAYFGESSGGGLHSVQRGVLDVVSPIQEGASKALKPVRDLFGWFGSTFDAKKQRDQLAKERDQLAKDQAAIKAERDALAARLSNALGAVADTKSTARGTVTSLSGVLFDTGKATLKPEAKLTLAKLAGVMLVFSKTAMSIEGYTDNVGSDATNMKLSTDRAKAVRDFFESQGIQSNRLTYVGKGPADPVAPNDTPDGRSKNRRVEIVSSEPQL